MNRLFLAAALYACLAAQIHAQSPAAAVLVSEPPSPYNVRIWLIGAGDRSFPVAINGRAVGAIGPASAFSAIYTPGTIDIVVSGRRFEAKAHIVSAANEVYVFEVSSPSGPDPTVTLKRRGFQFLAPLPQLAELPPGNLISTLAP
jgi:hypothetical protein